MERGDYELVLPNLETRLRNPGWLQDAAGWILVHRVRSYAVSRIDPALAPEGRAAVEKGIDDTLYGLMMLLEGVSESLSGAHASREDAMEEIRLVLLARHVTCAFAKDERVVQQELNLNETHELCMGIHGWLEGDFYSHGFIGPKWVPAGPPVPQEEVDPNAVVPADALGALACAPVPRRDRVN